MTTPTPAQREQRELAHYREDPHERPGADSLPNLINKLRECGVFLHGLPAYRSLFFAAQTVLEIGGGQGWAACALKREFPLLQVTLTDLSPEAVSSVAAWERVMEVELDRAVAASAEQLPVEDASQDVVFAFSAAHHFARPGVVLQELWRVLRPGGTALYLNEPVCPGYWRPLARWRVNRKGRGVYEDLIVPRELLAQARACGFQAELHHRPHTLNRGPLAGFYYLILSRLPWLQRWLPCTADVVLRKPAR